MEINNGDTVFKIQRNDKGEVHVVREDMERKPPPKTERSSVRHTECLKQTDQDRGQDISARRLAVGAKQQNAKADTRGRGGS